MNHPTDMPAGEGGGGAAGDGRGDGFGRGSVDGAGKGLAGGRGGVVVVVVDARGAGVVGDSGGTGGVGAASDAGWQSAVAQVLDESHVTAFGRDDAAVTLFCDELVSSLSLFPDVRVGVIEGRAALDLNGLCVQLEGVLRRDRIARRFDGPRGILDALRHRATDVDGDVPPMRRAVRERYIIWRHADALLSADAGLFGRAVDALLGVAAELEYVTDDLLLVQRVVFTGGPVLAACAEDERGPLRSWLASRMEDGCCPGNGGVEGCRGDGAGLAGEAVGVDGGGKPVSWGKLSGLERPRMTLYSVDERRVVWG